MDDNEDFNLRKKMEQLVLERTHLSGVSRHSEKDEVTSIVSPYDEDDDDTWVTSAEVRIQQLEKERNQQALPENSFKGTGLQPKESLSHDLPFSARPPRYKDSVSAGLSCSLCYVTTLDTNLMDQHLMGQFHTANAEKAAQKWRRENGFEEEVGFRDETVNVGKERKEVSTRNETVNVLEKEFKEASFHNEGEKQLKETVSPRKEIVNVGENKLRDSFHTETIDEISEIEKSSEHVKLNKHGSKEKIVNGGIEASGTDDTKTTANFKVPVVELNNNLKDKEKTEEIPVEVGKKADAQYDKSVTETTKEKDTENNPVHEDAKARNTNETNNNSDCDVCKIFSGGDGQIQRHQIPSHACIGEDLGVLALPAGWTEKVSRTSGGTYYVNNLTKEPQWVRPVEPVIFPKGTEEEEQLPEGWVEKKSKSKGCPYYLNKITNQRQWDKPTKAAQMSVPVDSSLTATK